MESIEAERFYYLRDELDRPMVTICLVAGPKGVGKGVAVCSVDDNPVKKIGRRLARDRAIRSYWTSANNKKLWTDNAIQVIYLVLGDGFKARELIGKPKSHFNPELTAYEKKLLFPPTVPKCRAVKFSEIASNEKLSFSPKDYLRTIF
jgi:hypothetical protein